ncbi:MAG: hypothetical protein N4A54_00525 [Peptostreptococcaceae bacterium]|jgi:uncharacterized protein YoxC|nr:hypothetical protein [Peptostreptococcaceae bacterium]
MSSLKTNEYKLHKWEDDDNVSRVEFNENFDKLDNKLKEIDSVSNNIYDKTNNLQEQISIQNTKYEELNNKIKNDVGDISGSLSSNINTINNKIKANTNSVSSLDRKITDNKNFIDTTNKKIDSNSTSLTSKISSNTSKITTNKNNITKANEAITGIKSTTATLINNYKKIQSSVNTQNQKNDILDSDIKAINKSIHDLKITSDVHSQYTDSGLASYKTGRGSIRINVDRNSLGSFDVSPKICRGRIIKKAIFTISSKDEIVSIKMETIKEGQGWFVTGPYVYNRKTYFGSWYTDGKPIVGKDYNGILRGAIMDGNTIKTIFGTGSNVENCKIREAFINDKSNKITFRYENEKNSFYSDIKIDGIGI